MSACSSEREKPRSPPKSAIARSGRRGIAAYLKNGGTREIANHDSTRTAQLYDLWLARTGSPWGLRRSLPATAFRRRGNSMTGRARLRRIRETAIPRICKHLFMERRRENRRCGVPRRHRPEPSVQWQSVRRCEEYYRQPDPDGMDLHDLREPPDDRGSATIAPSTRPRPFTHAAAASIRRRTGSTPANARKQREDHGATVGVHEIGRQLLAAGRLGTRLTAIA